MSSFLFYFIFGKWLSKMFDQDYSLLRLQNWKLTLSWQCYHGCYKTSTGEKQNNYRRVQEREVVRHNTTEGKTENNTLQMTHQSQYRCPDKGDTETPKQPNNKSCPA